MGKEAVRCFFICIYAHCYKAFCAVLFSLCSCVAQKVFRLNKILGEGETGSVIMPTMIVFNYRLSRTQLDS